MTAAARTALLLPLGSFLALALTACSVTGDERDPADESTLASPTPKARPVAIATATPPDYPDRLSLERTGVAYGRPIAFGGAGATPWMATPLGLYELDLSTPGDTSSLRPLELFPTRFWQVLELEGRLWARDFGAGLWRRDRDCASDCWTRVWSSAPPASSTPPVSEGNEGLNFPLEGIAGMAGEGLDDIREIAAVPERPDLLLVLSDRGARLLDVGSDEVLDVGHILPNEGYVFVAEHGLDRGTLLLNEIPNAQAGALPESVGRLRAFALESGRPPREIASLMLPFEAQRNTLGLLPHSLPDGSFVVVRRLTDETELERIIVQRDAGSGRIRREPFRTLSENIANARIVDQRIWFGAWTAASLRHLDVDDPASEPVEIRPLWEPGSVRDYRDALVFVGVSEGLVLLRVGNAPSMRLLDTTRSAETPDVVEIGPWPDCDALQLEPLSISCIGSGRDIVQLDRSELRHALAIPDSCGLAPDVSNDSSELADLLVLAAEEQREDALSESSGFPASGEWSPSVVTTGDHAFLYLGDEIVSFEISSEEPPTLIDRFGPIEGFAWASLALDGDHLILVPGPGHGGVDFLVLDVSDPGHLRELRRAPVQGFSVGTFGGGPWQGDAFPGLLFLPGKGYDAMTGRWNESLVVLDVRDPHDMHVIGELSGIGYIRDVAFCSDRILLTTFAGIESYRLTW